MARQYCAFLVRCWRLVDGDGRFTVAHVQSGGSARVASLAAALDWLAAHLPGDDAAGGAPGAPEGGAMTNGDQ